MQRIAIALLLTLFSGVLFSQESDRVQVIDHADSLHAQLKITTSSGKVSLADVFRAVSRYNGYDDAELSAVLPAGELSLESGPAIWTIATLNRVLRPCVQVSHDANSFDITVDRESARNWINQRKSGVRNVWNRVDWRSEPPTYGIEMISAIDAKDSADIVVLVHGLNSRPEDVAGFIPLVEQADLVAATFRYPNDQPIDKSAALLAEELEKLATKYPQRRVRLLTHSMGGLVARATVETDLDPGNVSQLIMIAPPNHGSSLARVASFMDCYEFFTSAHHRRSGVLVESVSDGLGEATADLAPGSVFLDSLNQLKRNPQVQYTILLGTDGPMTQDEMTELRNSVRQYSDGNRYFRFLSSKLNRALDGLNEVVEGSGDGVVSCERGKLEGVADIIELPFSHAGILSANASSSKKAYSIILDRLSR